MMRTVWLAFLVACGGQNAAWDACSCPMAAHGAVDAEGQCRCLPLLPTDPDAEPGHVFWVGEDGAEGPGSESEPWASIDWVAIDAALADGDVHVRFTEGRYDDRLDVLRTDEGPHRLVLDGAIDGRDRRASIAGIGTDFEDVPRHRVTVRGFEVTKSRDKGVYWRAGDDVVLEDLVVHDNRGTPSINLEYANRTGLPSTGFTVRNSHIYDQTGECLYIGGAEGTDMPSHANIVIENNLIHDCRGPGLASTKADAINIKDRMTGVRVERNVVARSDWGLELGSPGVYRSNRVFDTRREGVTFNDSFSTFSGVVLEDTVVVRSGGHGLRITPQQGVSDVLVDGFVSIDAGEAGVTVGGPAEGIVLDGLLLLGDQAFFGWDSPEVGVLACEADGVDDGPFETGCAEPTARGSLDPAGPDGVFFTDDDPVY